MGQTFGIDGIPVRLTPGRKGPHDIRVEWCAGGQWRAPGYRALGTLTDILGENEDWVYQYGDGHNRLLSYLDAAACFGVNHAERYWNDRG